MQKRCSLAVATFRRTAWLSQMATRPRRPGHALRDLTVAGSPLFRPLTRTATTKTSGICSTYACFRGQSRITIVDNTTPSSRLTGTSPLGARPYWRRRRRRRGGAVRPASRVCWSSRRLHDVPRRDLGCSRSRPRRSTPVSPTSTRSTAATAAWRTVFRRRKSAPLRPLSLTMARAHTVRAAHGLFAERRAPSPPHCLRGFTPTVRLGQRSGMTLDPWAPNCRIVACRSRSGTSRRIWRTSAWPRSRCRSSRSAAPERARPRARQAGARSRA